MTRLIQYITIDNEDALKQNVSNHNIAHLNLRTDMTKFAVQYVKNQEEDKDYSI